MKMMIDDSRVMNTLSVTTREMLLVPRKLIKSIKNTLLSLMLSQVLLALDRQRQALRPLRNQLLQRVALSLTQQQWIIEFLMGQRVSDFLWQWRMGWSRVRRWQKRQVVPVDTTRMPSESHFLEASSGKKHRHWVSQLSAEQVSRPLHLLSLWEITFKNLSLFSPNFVL